MIWKIISTFLAKNKTDMIMYKIILTFNLSLLDFD